MKIIKKSQSLETNPSNYANAVGTRYCEICGKEIGLLSNKEWEMNQKKCQDCIKQGKTRKDVTAGNDCGGFRPPKGHLDTQLFPECENTETDRNIVKKTVERRKKKKANIITAKHGFPIIQENENQPWGIWDQWKNGVLDDRRFVDLIKQLSQLGFTGISKDPYVRKGIMNALKSFNETRDYAEAARSIGSFLSLGANVLESYFAESDNWYKRARQF